MKNQSPYKKLHSSISLNFEIFIILRILGGQKKFRAALAGMVLRSPIHTWRARRFGVYRWDI